MKNKFKKRIININNIDIQNFLNKEAIDYADMDEFILYKHFNILLILRGSFNKKFVYTCSCCGKNEIENEKIEFIGRTKKEILKKFREEDDDIEMENIRFENCFLLICNN
jgi:hypothetical protein